MRKCIVVVDMQNDFIDGSLGTPEAQAMLPHLINKLEKEREAALIFTQDTHSKDYLETQEGRNLPVRHCAVAIRRLQRILSILLPRTKFLPISAKTVTTKCLYC